MRVSKKKILQKREINREGKSIHKNTEYYPGSTLQGLRPVPLQNPARAFTSTKSPIHLTIFDQEIASPTLSSTVQKIVT